MKIVPVSKSPVNSHSKFPDRHAKEPKTVLIGSSPQKRKPSVEVSGTPVKKPKPPASPQSSSSNLFDILEQEVEDVCKVCGKGFKHILKHLRQAAKCRAGYGPDYDRLREEKKKSRKPKALSETKKAQWIEDIYQHFENQLEKLNAAKNARVEELRASQRSKRER